MKLKRIIYITLVIICMATIFIFSSRNSTSSNSTSKGIINYFITVYENTFDKKVNKKELVNKLNYPVRKIAHYSIYFCLGIFVYNLVLLTKIKYKKLVTIIICFSYAIFDEIHQLFILGRTGQIKDVLIDNLGVLTAVFILSSIYKYKSKKANIN